MEKILMENSKTWQEDEISKTTRVHVVLDIDYELASESPSDMVRLLANLIPRAIGNGMLTGDTDSIVETHDVHILEATSDDLALSEDSISSWIAQRIETGDIELNDIPKIMARYALSDPVAMRQEILECMKQNANCDTQDEKFYVNLARKSGMR